MAQDLKRRYQRAQNTVRAEARQAFRETLNATNIRILRQRAKDKTTQSILGEAILLLLEHGPLRTVELHPFVQRIHPDICDDSVDRVIDGVHFGKRWKHYVRSAQQALKRANRIRFDGERWHLVPTV